MHAWLTARRRSSPLNLHLRWCQISVTHTDTVGESYSIRAARYEFEEALAIGVRLTSPTYVHRSFIDNVGAQDVPYRMSPLEVVLTRCAPKLDAEEMWLTHIRVRVDGLGPHGAGEQELQGLLYKELPMAATMDEEIGADFSGTISLERVAVTLRQSVAAGSAARFISLEFSSPVLLEKKERGTAHSPAYWLGVISGAQSGTGCRVYLYGHQSNAMTLRYASLLMEPKEGLAPPTITLSTTSKQPRDRLKKENWLRRDLGVFAFHAGLHRRLYHMFQACPDSPAPSTAPDPVCCSLRGPRGCAGVAMDGSSILATIPRPPCSALPCAAGQRQSPEAAQLPDRAGFPARQ